MGKVVYCWELGGGLGHITSFLPIAKRLQEQDHEVVYVVRSLLDTDQLIGQYGTKVFQAPYWHSKVRNLPEPVNYAEMLFRFGYLHEALLIDMAMGWQNLLQAINPDLLVFDHAPTAIMASKCIPAKRALFGTGFCSPPRTDPMPCFRPWEKPPLQRLKDSEKRALKAINTVLARLNVPALERFMDLFDCDEDFLTTFPELDHYGNRGQVRYWGATMSRDEGENPAWPDTKPGPNIFAYLKGEAGDVEKVLHVLKNVEANVLVYATGFSMNKIKMFQTERLTFSPKMLNLKKVSENCDLVICHGGHATVARALLGGIPLVLLPTQLEQFIMATNIVRFGAGTMINHHDKNADYAGAVQRALEDKTIRQKAMEFAARHADFDQEQQVADIATRINELLVSA